jgi:hypothetical protein
VEAFSSSLKSEVADRFYSWGEAKMKLFDYIEVFYNHDAGIRPRTHESSCRGRTAQLFRHSALGVMALRDRSRDGGKPCWSER